MASEEKYPQIRLTDSTIIIKVKDDDQAERVMSEIRSVCVLITESYSPKEQLRLCGGNFYLVRYIKERKEVQISQMLPQPPRYYHRREIV